MIEVRFTPVWFYGKDIIIDIISIIVLVLIAITAFNYYSINKNKKYFLFGLSFSMIAAAFAARILTNFTVYYPIFEEHEMGLITYTYHTIRSTNTLFSIGYLVFRILSLAGLYLLYCIYNEPKKENIFLTLYLLITMTYFSHYAYYIFDITSLIIISLIILQLYKTYLKKKHPSTKLSIISFTIIASSYVIFIFVMLNPVIYVIADIVQLLGYSLLLITFLQVLNNGEKKKQA